jgi:hypothetical protein
MRTTGTTGSGPLGGRRELLTCKGESRAPSYKEIATLPPDKLQDGEHKAVDGILPKGNIPVSEQLPFSNNIVSAFTSLYKAFRKTMLGKSEKSAAIRYNSDYISNLFELSDELKNRTYRMGPYNSFKVMEPKERDILSISFRDKVVLHSLCDNFLEPLLCKGFIIDNYANQKGKGLHFGLKRLEYFLRSYFLCHKAKQEEINRKLKIKMPLIKDYNYHNGWIIKGDVKKYFHSINHGILLSMLYKKLAKNENKKDAAMAFWLSTKIIQSTKEDGIPIGNQTSQLFALLFLDGFDHYIKQDLKIKYYGRYMDDFYIIVETKEEAKEILKKITEYLSELKLTINKKTNIFPLSHGIDFLGFHTYLTSTGKIIKKIRRKSKINMKRKLKKYELLLNKGKITLDKIEECYKCWRAHIKHGNTYLLRYAIDRLFLKLFPLPKQKIFKRRWIWLNN